MWSQWLPLPARTCSRLPAVPELAVRCLIVVTNDGTAAATVKMHAAAITKAGVDFYLAALRCREFAYFLKSLDGGLILTRMGVRRAQAAGESEGRAGRRTG